MRRLTALLSLLLLAACGGGSRTIRSTGPTPQMDVPGLQGMLDSFREVPTSTASFAATRAVVWPALVAVYQEMEIPVTTVDGSSYVIGGGDQRVRRVGGKRIQDYVTCVDSYGSSSSYDIYLTIMTRLEPAEGGSTVARTQVVATGKPLTRSARVGCATSGTLELAIANGVRAKLGLPTATH
jgi:hypothetical protein